MKRLHSSRGVSLIEFIIYVGILIILSVSSINSAIALSRSYRSLQSTIALDANAQIALERILRETRDATGYSASLSTTGTSTGRLTLTTTDDAGATTTAEFYLSNQQLRIKVGGTDLGPLTQSNVRVTSLVFTPITTSKSQAMKVALVLEYGAGSLYKQKSYFSSVVMRGSYPNE